MRNVIAEKQQDSAEDRGEEQLLHHELTRTIIGAFYSVHSQLGAGFLESVYANSMAVMLRQAGIRVEREVPFEISFQGVSVGRFKADMVVDSCVVVEVKAARLIDPSHCAQVLNYLRVSQLEVGLLLNFAHRAEFKRVVAIARAKNKRGTP